MLRPINLSANNDIVFFSLLSGPCYSSQAVDGKRGVCMCPNGAYHHALPLFLPATVLTCDRAEGQSSERRHKLTKWDEISFIHLWNVTIAHRCRLASTSDPVHESAWLHCLCFCMCVCVSVGVSVWCLPSESMLLSAVGGMMETLHWPRGHLRGYRSIQAVCTYKNNSKCNVNIYVWFKTVIIANVHCSHKNTNNKDSKNDK